MRALPGVGLDGLTDATLELWDDVTGLAREVLVEAVLQLPPVQDLDRRNRDRVQRAFEQGRAYERERLGLPLRSHHVPGSPGHHLRLVE